jgi:chromosome segregation ATPase
MSETTTVSMPSELKRFADEHNVSPSEMVQEAIKEEMEKRGGKEEQLRNKKAELESVIETIEDDLSKKKEELQEVEEKLAQLQNNKSEAVKEMNRGIEAYHSEDITSEQATNRLDIQVSGEEVEECYSECVDNRRFDDSIPAHLRKMVESEGADADQLILDYKERDLHEYRDAKEIVQTNITGLERERIEDWVQNNLEN